MSDDRESSRGLLGLLGVGMVVCCGLPILLAGGIAVGAANAPSAATSPPSAASTPPRRSGADRSRGAGERKPITHLSECLRRRRVKTDPCDTNA